MRNFIYILTDPLVGDPRYVGMSVSPERRLQQHVADARLKAHPSRFLQWIAALDDLGEVPSLMCVAEIICKQDGFDLRTRACGCGRRCRVSLSAEREWIRWLRDEGHDLLNQVPRDRA